MITHPPHQHPGSTSCNLRPYPQPTDIAARPTVNSTKPPGIFTPFCCEDLGDFDELNWEIFDGGIVHSPSLSQELQNAPGSVGTNLPSTSRIKFSGPIDWHEPTYGVSHITSPKAFESRTYWSSLLAQLQTVDLFVRDALLLNKPAVSNSLASIPAAANLAWLGKRYMHKILDTELPGYPDLQYSEHINLFLKHVNTPQFRRQLDDANTTTCAPTPINMVVDTKRDMLFKTLVHNICAEGHSAAFKKICSDRQGNIQQNIKNYCTYVDEIVARYVELRVVRIDLEYTPMAVQGLTIDQARKDLNRFLNNRRHKKLFAGQMGFIWKLENSDGRGLHFHLISFHIGADLTQQQHLAQQIGEYWIKVTQQRGSYRDCSRSDYSFKRLGIGRLCKGVPEMRANIFSVIKYLCKRDQALSIKGVPVIRHGQFKSSSHGATALFPEGLSLV